MPRTRKRVRDEEDGVAAPAAASVTVDLDALPEPVPEGRKAPDVLRREQLEAALEALARGWPDGPVGTLALNPTRLSLKWKASEARLVEAALRTVGGTLRTLDLSPGSVNAAMPPSVSAAVVAHCRELQSLRLSEAPCAPATLAALGDLAHLRELTLGGIAVSIAAPLEASALASLGRCPRLRLLHVTDTRIGDEVLQAIARGCPGLEDVDLCGSESLTHAGVAALARHCPGLHRLELRNCEAVGPEGVRALAACSRLHDLNLQRVRGAASGFKAVAEACLRLSAVSLSSCFLLDDDVLALASLRDLAALDLNAAHGFAAASLARALPALSALRRLSLNGMRFPGTQLDDAVRALAENGGARALEHLDLNNSSVTGAAVAVVRRRWPDCDVTTVHCRNL